MPARLLFAKLKRNRWVETTSYGKKETTNGDVSLQTWQGSLTEGERLSTVDLLLQTNLDQHLHI
jgi:hypothetical protein